MQGYILNLNRVRDEDLIVTIVSQTNLHTVYRFYGARHGSVTVGFKIDFELEHSQRSIRLKDVMHIGFSWLYDRTKLRLWQNFITLFYKHFAQTDELESFYFHLIEEAAQQWDKQNPKRVAIEAYAKLLSFEGRLHEESICFFCNTPIIAEDLCVLRAYLPSHQECAHKRTVSKEGFQQLLQQQTSFFLNDEEVEVLWNTLLEGL
jgi:hypothetical protein